MIAVLFYLWRMNIIQVKKAWRLADFRQFCSLQIDVLANKFNDNIVGSIEIIGEEP
jgi:hypothetical protein